MDNTKQNNEHTLKLSGATDVKNNRFSVQQELFHIVIWPTVDIKILSRAASSIYLWYK